MDNQNDEPSDISLESLEAYLDDRRRRAEIGVRVDSKLLALVRERLSMGPLPDLLSDTLSLLRAWCLRERLLDGHKVTLDGALLAPLSDDQVASASDPDGGMERLMDACVLSWARRLGEQTDALAGLRRLLEAGGVLIRCVDQAGLARVRNVVSADLAAARRLGAFTPPREVGS
jgi:hypothetical protein